MGMVENVVTGIWNLLGSGSGQDALTWATGDAQLQENPRAMYQLRRMLYDNQWAFTDKSTGELVLGLRNPTAAAVKFHGFTTWPGSLPDALPIVTSLPKDRSQELTSAIHQIWTWSDWQTKKQEYARHKARDGDGLIQIATRSSNGVIDQVYFNLVDVEHLTDFDTDQRGFLTWLRLDVPMSRRMNDGTLQRWIHTEVWDKERGDQRVWDHQQGLNAAIDDLKVPDEINLLMDMTGTNMIPFVHGRHISEGDKRGAAAIDHALVKAFEASRMATRLHELGFIYGEPDLQITTIHTHDSQGRAIQTPRIKTNEKGVVKLGGKNLWEPPAGFHLEGVPADVQLEQLRLMLQDHLQHIQEGDLPQLAYYKLASSSRDLSGEALGHMLKPAIELAIEARGNSESELVRANQIALTMAIHHGLVYDRTKPFRNLGSYDRGDFDHRFAEREIIPMTATERAEVEKKRSETAINRQGYGWSDRALLKEDGLTEEEITLMDTERETTERERGERLLRAGAAGDVDRDV